jgi:hypothetical protein
MPTQAEVRHATNKQLEYIKRLHKEAGLRIDRYVRCRSQKERETQVRVIDTAKYCHPPAKITDSPAHHLDY